MSENSPSSRNDKRLWPRRTSFENRSNSNYCGCSKLRKMLWITGLCLLSFVMCQAENVNKVKNHVTDSKRSLLESVHLPELLEEGSREDQSQASLRQGRISQDHHPNLPRLQQPNNQPAKNPDPEKQSIEFILDSISSDFTIADGVFNALPDT